MRLVFLSFSFSFFQRRLLRLRFYLYPQTKFSFNIFYLFNLIAILRMAMSEFYCFSIDLPIPNSATIKK